MTAAAELAAARALRAAGQLHEAALGFQAAVNLDGSLDEAWLGLVQCLAERGALERATGALDAWCSARPMAEAGQAVAAVTLAEVLGADAPDQAHRFLTQAFSFDPLLPAAHRVAATLSARAGDLDAALLAAETAHALDPANREAALLVALLTLDLRGDPTPLQHLWQQHPTEARIAYRLEQWHLDQGDGASARAINQAFNCAILPGDPIAAEWHHIDNADHAAARAIWLAAGAGMDRQTRNRRFDAPTQVARGHLVPAVPDLGTATRRTIARVADLPLVMLLLVKDEVSLVQHQIQHHLERGVSRVIVTDNGSTDGTRDVLADLAAHWPIDIIDEAGTGWHQDLWTTRMAWIAAERYGAHWLFSADADELWYADTDLPEAIARDAAVYGPDTSLLLAAQRLMVPDAEGPPFAATRVIDRPLGIARRVGRADCFYWRHAQLPKAIVRGARVTALWPGNHFAVGPDLHWGAATSVEVHHHHLREFAWFHAKVRRVAETMALNPAWGAHAGLYQRLAGLSEVELHAEWRQGVWPAPALAALTSACAPQTLGSGVVPPGDGTNLSDLAASLTAAIPRFNLARK